LMTVHCSLFLGGVGQATEFIRYISISVVKRNWIHTIPSANDINAPGGRNMHYRVVNLSRPQWWSVPQARLVVLKVMTVWWTKKKNTIKMYFTSLQIDLK
jgi:hypothetical protein